jgi:hypothetical protein
VPDNDEKSPVCMPRQKVAFSAEASYLLVNSVRDFGRSILIWMVENGARDLVYLSQPEEEFIDKLSSM